MAEAMPLALLGRGHATQVWRQHTAGGRGSRRKTAFNHLENPRRLRLQAVPCPRLVTGDRGEASALHGVIVQVHQMRGKRCDIHVRRNKSSLDPDKFRPTS